MKYGTVFYDACELYSITPMQWLYLDMIRGLSTLNDNRGYFAHASNKYYAKSLGVSVKTIQNYSRALDADGWLIIKDDGHRKTTHKFNSLYMKCSQGEKIAPVKNLHGGGENISRGGVKNLHGGGENISPNNNSIITEDNNRDNITPFSIFFDTFKEKVGISAYWKGKKQKAKVKRVWDSLSKDKQKLALEGIDNYLKAYEARRATHKELIKVSVHTYLDGSRWEDEIPTVAKNASVQNSVKAPSMKKRPVQNDFPLLDSLMK